MKIRTTLKTSLATAALLMVGCEGLPIGEEDVETKEDAEELLNDEGEIVDAEEAFEGTVTISGQLDTEGASLQSVNWKVNCVTFEETPRAASSTVDDEGKFSNEVPRNVQFGCFVVDADDNNAVVATIIAAASTEEGGFGDSDGDSTLALNEPLELGRLAIKDGKVEIPAATYKKARGRLADKLLMDLDQVHDKEYRMSCISTGDEEADAKCEEWISDEEEGADKVYMRIIKGDKDGKPIVAMSIWESKETFNACGGFDMPQKMKEKIEADGFTLTQVSAGEFKVGEAGCETRDRDDKEGENEHEPGPEMNLQDDGSDDHESKERDDHLEVDGFHALERLRKAGPGYILSINEDDSHGECRFKFKMDILFTSKNKSADVMFGAFKEEQFSRGCGDEDGHKVEARNIKFTRL